MLYFIGITRINHVILINSVNKVLSKLFLNFVFYIFYLYIYLTYIFYHFSILMEYCTIVSKRISSFLLNGKFEMNTFPQSA